MPATALFVKHLGFHTVPRFRVGAAHKGRDPDSNDRLNRGTCVPRPLSLLLSINQKDRKEKGLIFTKCQSGSIGANRGRFRANRGSCEPCRAAVFLRAATVLGHFHARSHAFWRCAPFPFCCRCRPCSFSEGPETGRGATSAAAPMVDQGCGERLAGARRGAIGQGVPVGPCGQLASVLGRGEGRSSSTLQGAHRGAGAPCAVEKRRRGRNRPRAWPLRCC